MLKKDGPIFLQNINMIARQLFLLFKKSTTFWDNPRTRAQRRVFKRKLFAVTNLAPGSLSDFIYKELTLDGAAAAHPITQERLRLISLGHTGLIADLRHLNPGRPSNTFDTSGVLLGPDTREK